jgi:hypothetical protein
MIVVSLAGLAYIWFVDIMGKITESTAGVMNQTLVAFGTQFRIEVAKYDTNNNITVSLRNTGTQNIDMSKLAAYIEDETAEINSGNTGIAEPGDVRTIGVTNTTEVCGKVIKITTAVGVSDSRTVSC